MTPSTTAEVRRLMDSANRTGSVNVGFIHDTTVAAEFAWWLMRLLPYDAARRRLLTGGGIVRVRSGPMLAEGRNEIVRGFLTHGADWLWMVDIDMSFPDNALYDMVDAADPHERPIMAGAYLWTRAGEAVTPCFALPAGADTRAAIDARAVVEAELVGAGCLLVHRSVFETLAGIHPDPWPWFGYDVSPSGVAQGEDVTFCRRATAAGFPIHVHTGVRGVHHAKPVDLRF